MRKNAGIGILALVAFVLTAACALAAPFVIDDSTYGTGTYWGGAYFQTQPANFGDVIGDPDYSISQMTITRGTGGKLTVRVEGDYFSKGINEDNKFYSPGDLYINSNGWNATQSQGGLGHYETDIFSLNEGWNYVVSFENRALYALTSDITMTNAANPETNWIFRKNQAWRGGYGQLVEGADVVITGEYLEFTFDSAPLNLANEFGLHWTMRCGNDVVEGLDPAPVPEPATLILLGSGLIVAGVFRRRSRNP
jgi:hypothetical protein